MMASIPSEVATRLGDDTKKFSEQQCAELTIVWQKLQDVMWAKGQTIESCIDRARSEQSEKDPKKSLAWELLVSLVTSQLNDSDPSRRPSDAALDDQCQLCKALLNALGFKPLPTVTLRRYPQPRQSFPEAFVHEVKVAREVEARLLKLFQRIHAGQAPPLASAEEKTGALILALAFDAGVLSVSELRAILTARHEPVRAVDGHYYIWLKLAESRSSVQEYRRVLLPDLSAALAIAGQTAGQERHLNIKQGLKAVSRRLGYGSKYRLSIKGIHRGVAARLRTHGAIPQFVVDYCDYRIHSNSLNESAWRRLKGYVPWPDDIVPEESTTRASDAEAESLANDEVVDDTAIDEVGQVMRVFRNATDTRDSRAKIGVILEKLDQSKPPVIRHLLEWLLDLHQTISSNGKVRRVNSIRNLFTALAPRLIAGVGKNEIQKLDEDEWQYILDLALDEQLSESWRSTIQYSFWSFLKFMERRGVVTQSPMGDWVGRMASHVNANILSHAEFRRCMEEVADTAGNDKLQERWLMRLLLVLGFQLGLRKSEGVGITFNDIDSGLRPTLDIVHNDFRKLKTDSSERRVPLGLLDMLYCETLIAVSEKSDNRKQRIIDALETGIETDSTIRKVIQIIKSVTEDDSTRYHTLRHSAATWTLIALCADSLQLDRLTGQFPFLTDALKTGPNIRYQLRGRQSRLHDLHAVKQLLGHRHEEMTLLHYIHCMDVLRYAAVTLGLPRVSPATLFGAAGITRWNRALRGKKQEAAILSPLRFIESQYADNVRRHDVKLAPRAPSLSIQIQSSATMHEWLDASKQSAANGANHLGGFQAATAIDTKSAARLVDTINASKILGSKKTIKSLEEIKPRVRAEMRLALGLSEAIKSDRENRFDHAGLAQQVLGAAMARSFGWYRYDSAVSAAPAIKWLEYLGTATGIRLVCGREINTTDIATKKRRRHIVEYTDLKSLLDAGASRVLFRLQLVNGGKRKSFPHSTFVWALAMYALTRNSV